ncbi:MAG: dodecin domain-containing protein [Candidatus Krumholzibacteriota bacterium]|nr:dodecin domain-containing protein [Candidatus Krumholzibacteriota bacterium]
MADHVYKTIEITGTSPKGIEEAVGTALKKASDSVHKIRWFEVTDTRGSVDKDHVAQWQVTVKIAFTLDD